MTYTARAYQGEADLAKLQTFMATVAEEAGICGLLHPGDVPHRLYNALRTEDVSKMARLWEDSEGRVVAWTLLYPRFKGMDFFVLPKLWGTPFVGEVLAQTEATLRQIMAERELTGKINTDGSDCDPQRVALLKSQGWERGDSAAFIYSRRSLDLPIPPLQLPEGFTIRSAKGIEEAEALAEVHHGGFGSNWTAELYAKLMQSPGYQAEREIVVVAPEGRFAAFCVWWPDPINKVGLFEPVATHHEFRRMGLGRELLYETMRRMKAAGMREACVTWEGDNEASRGLYESVGFVAQHEIYNYEKA